jgi:hypothetical protein
MADLPPLPRGALSGAGRGVDLAGASNARTCADGSTVRPRRILLTVIERKKRGEDESRNCATARPVQARAPGRRTGAVERVRPAAGAVARGLLREAARRLFPTLSTEAQGAETVLAGALADQAALYGVIAQIEALGLELIEVRRTHS